MTRLIPTKIMLWFWNALPGILPKSFKATKNVFKLNTKVMYLFKYYSHLFEIFMLITLKGSINYDFLLTLQVYSKPKVATTYNRPTVILFLI